MKKKRNKANSGAAIKAPNQDIAQGELRDPIEDLLIGIQFRNGGKPEAMDRIRSYAREEYRRGVTEGIEKGQAAGRTVREVMDFKDRTISRLMARLARIKAEHANELIEALSGYWEVEGNG